MNREARTFRFAVGTVDGVRSSEWRIWSTRHGDVYVGYRDSLETLKVSLHNSGAWRLAHISEGDTLGPGGMLEWTPPAPGDYDDAIASGSLEDRAIVKWRKPDELLRGLTSAFQIEVPSSELRRHPNMRAGRRSVRWLSDPGRGQMTCVRLFITEMGEEDDWPGKRAMGTNLLKRIPIGPGLDAEVVTWSQRVPPTMQRQIRTDKRIVLNHHAKVIQELRASGAVSARGHIFQRLSDGTRCLIDTAFDLT